MTRQGYMVRHRRGHPRADVNHFVLEHLIVMEETLGRPLDESETVHHKNGNRSDNRPENLELWASNHPSGQRVIDLVRWADQILSKYGDFKVENVA
jgi:hypothetical protein